jgi:murein DD-endopeptidase MepM/ murein hydrolase activator NlpD
VRVARRLALVLLLALVVAAPAAGGDIGRRKRAIDERLSSLSSKIAQAQAREGALTHSIIVVNAQIHGLEDDVTRAQRKLGSLDHQLAVHQRSLDRLNTLVATETRKLVALRRSYSIALARLNRRLLDAYESPRIDTIDVVLATTSVSDMISNLEYVHRIGVEDKHISDSLLTAKREMARVRARTKRIQVRVAAETAAVRARRDAAHAIAQELISSQQQLAAARASKRSALGAIRVNEQQFRAEADRLQATSNALAAQIRAAQAKSGGGSSSGGGGAATSGLIWPVTGPITSPFGARCLPNGDCRSHPGIDIGVPSGTPVKAAAAGTVIVAGDDGSGYGNYVVIDHGNGLATVYGHNTSVAVGVGSRVAQGQVIASSGCTGYCFGPHLHFEVRVNGTPVDPMQYL